MGYFSILVAMSSAASHNAHRHYNGGIYSFSVYLYIQRQRERDKIITTAQLAFLCLM